MVLILAEQDLTKSKKVIEEDPNFLDWEDKTLETLRVKICAKDLGMTIHILKVLELEI